MNLAGTGIGQQLTTLLDPIDHRGVMNTTYPFNRPQAQTVRIQLQTLLTDLIAVAELGLRVRDKLADIPHTDDFVCHVGAHFCGHARNRTQDIAWLTPLVVHPSIMQRHRKLSQEFSLEPSLLGPKATVQLERADRAEGLEIT